MKHDPKHTAFEETAFGSMVQSDASAALAPSNEGGIVTYGGTVEKPNEDEPRLVIRGESLNPKIIGDDGETYLLVVQNKKPKLIHLPRPKSGISPYSAITDYLNCTFVFTYDGVGEFFFDLLACLGRRFGPIINRGRGIHGWQSSYSLGDTSALFGVGGQNGTGFLSLPGEACHVISDWKRLISFLKDRLGARITRWDGAVDDYTGQHSVDYAVKLYLSDQFNAGGNRPSCKQSGNWIEPDGSGRTFYVGKRENGKMARIYEKGMQLGAKWHPWVRWEIEYHNTDRTIPYEVLLEPGRYVAGAYPKALGWIRDDMQRIKTIQNTAEISYKRLTDTARVSLGPLINVMMNVEGSAEKVVEKLIREGIPRRLRLPLVGDLS
jgi:phage replication initiation protein